MKNRIYELRKEKNVSQSELANVIGVTRQAISLYEAGKREPKLATWQKLADFFGVSIAYLQGEQSIPNIEKIIKQIFKEYSEYPMFFNPKFVSNQFEIFSLDNIIYSSLNQLILIRSINNYLDDKKHSKIIYKLLNRDELNLEYLKKNFDVSSKSYSEINSIDNKIKKELSKYSSEEYFEGLKSLLNDMTLKEVENTDILDTWFAVLKRVTKK